MAQELIVLVDDEGRSIGTAPKLESHHGSTPLHLGFSCYVFNENGDLLVTQRALGKRVWPSVLTNSVCGHPMPSEDTVDAIKRRLDYELGMTAKDFKVILPDYKYKTPPYNGIVENEICPVFFARALSPPKPNPDEVEAHKWLAWDEFVKAAEADIKDIFSYWCKDQLKQLKTKPILSKFTYI